MEKSCTNCVYGAPYWGKTNASDVRLSPQLDGYVNYASIEYRIRCNAPIPGWVYPAGFGKDPRQVKLGSNIGASCSMWKESPKSKRESLYRMVYKDIRNPWRA